MNSAPPGRQRFCNERRVWQDDRKEQTKVTFKFYGSRKYLLGLYHFSQRKVLFINGSLLCSSFGARYGWPLTKRDNGQCCKCYKHRRFLSLCKSIFIRKTIYQRGRFCNATATTSAKDSPEPIPFESQEVVLKELRRNINYKENRLAGNLPHGLVEQLNVRALDVHNPDGASAAGKELDDLRPSKATKTIRACWDFMRHALGADKGLGWRLCVALFLMFVSKLLSVAVPFLLKVAVDRLTFSQNIAARTSSFNIFLVLWFIVGYGVARIFAIVTHELRNALFARVGLGVGRRITRAAFAYLHSLDMSFHNSSRTGAISRIVDRGTKSIMMILRALIFSFLPSFFELLLVCSILSIRFTWHLSAITVICFITYVVYTVGINNRMARVRRLMNVVDNEGSAKLSESLFGAETVKIFNNEEFELYRYDICLAAFEEASVLNEKLLAWLNAGQGMIFCVGLSAALTLSCYCCIQGRLSVGDVMMVNTMLQQLWVPLNFIGWQYRELKQSLIDMENLLDLFNRQPLIRDAQEAIKLQIHGGKITFENVSFAYPSEGITKDAIKPLLRNLSFEVPSGKTLAIVGESGSGKSTSLRLIYRLYEPIKGRILIDGQDIRQVSQNSLRDSIGMIPQDTLLFNDTIYFNIAYGKIDSTKEEVEQAARLAQIHDTIMKMPQGYQTIVGERGARLSGGERQRVAIARCLLKNPPILLCDEATSALDTKTEQEITQSLKQLGQNRTCIIVAHRLSTVIDADEILVMRDGCILERGTHMELLEDPDSAYAHMWSRQLREVDVSPMNDSKEQQELDRHHNGNYEDSRKEASTWISSDGNLVEQISSQHFGTE
eukprot:jgi/Galph1/160/GphlegSOOS_G4957.1